jgi:3-oxoacyl-[acyl-carrier protein] reductase
MSNLDNLPGSLEELFALKGKVALILGGGFGMGEQCSNWLAHVGCDVIVTDIIPERAANVANQVRLRGRRAYEAVGDMREPAVVDKVLAAAEAEMGGIDIVVSIIGEAAWVSFLDTTMDDWHKDQARNLEYFFYCSQWAAKSMVRRGVGGAICAIASVDGMQPSPMHAAYGVAKAGIISLVKTMALELGPLGIRVNCISPGSIKTPRAIARNGPEHADAQAKAMGIPLGRAGATQEIAHAVLYLVSDMARYITGVTLPVDGGWLSTRLDATRFTNSVQAAHAMADIKV